MDNRGHTLNPFLGYIYAVDIILHFESIEHKTKQRFLHQSGGTLDTTSPACLCHQTSRFSLHSCENVMFETATGSGTS